MTKIKDWINHLVWIAKFSDFYFRVGWSDGYHGHYYDPYHLGDLTSRQVKRYKAGWKKGKKDLKSIKQISKKIGSKYKFQL